MNFFFSNKKKNSLSLVLDIQSGLVRGTLVSFSKGLKPHVIFTYTKFIKNRTQGNGPLITKIMCKSLHEVLHNISKDGLHKANTLGLGSSIKSVYYMLSSPWAISQAKKVFINFEKETTVTEKIIKEITDKEGLILIKEFKQDLEKSSTSNIDLLPIEEKVFDVRLNGYSISEFKGKKANKLEVSLAVSVSSKKILEKISSEVHKVFHIKNEFFHGALLAHYIALRSISPGMDEYISVHVHGELTDIVVVNKGSGVYLASFPFGTYSLFRKLGRTMKQSPEIAKSLLSLYSEGKLEKSNKERVEKTVSNIIENWKKSFQNSLTNDGSYSLPKVVNLSIHENFENFQSLMTH
jgi:cell division ATPase FtsA